MIELTGILVIDLMINILGAILCVSAIIGALIIFFTFTGIFLAIAIGIGSFCKFYFGEKDKT